ncbi:MAG: hypothetical protein O3A42_18575 [Actinobacteria bacterium]|nr:hypothetical protein [Actinomycetota bacterium]
MALITLAGTVIMSAPTATAAQVRNVYTCTGTGLAGAGSQTVRANPGDTIRVFNNCGIPGGSTVFRYSASNPAVWESPNVAIAAGTSQTAVVGAIGTSTQSFGLSGITTNITTITVESVTEPVPPPPPFEPHDYLQQVGLPASGSCNDVPAETGHWHGSPMGGWSQSWAWWPNGGRGGPVCTRVVETTDTGQLILVG